MYRLKKNVDQGKNNGPFQRYQVLFRLLNTPLACQVYECLNRATHAKRFSNGLKDLLPSPTILLSTDIVACTAAILEYVINAYIKERSIKGEELKRSTFRIKLGKLLRYSSLLPKTCDCLMI